VAEPLGWQPQRQHPGVNEPNNPAGRTRNTNGEGLIPKLSAWERTAAKLCFASGLDSKQSFWPGRSQAELGNEVVCGVRVPDFPVRC
jgi:hypothetical protein